MGYKVLLIEGNEGLLHLLRHSLEEQGMEVESTTSMIDAFKIAMTRMFDVIVIHGENGERLQSRLQQAGCHTPIVYVSGGALSGERLVRAVKSVVQFVVA